MLLGVDHCKNSVETVSQVSLRDAPGYSFITALLMVAGMEESEVYIIRKMGEISGYVAGQPYQVAMIARHWINLCYHR